MGGGGGQAFLWWLRGREEGRERKECAFILYIYILGGNRKWSTCMSVKSTEREINRWCCWRSPSNNIFRINTEVKLENQADIRLNIRRTHTHAVALLSLSVNRKVDEYYSNSEMAKGKAKKEKRKLFA